MAVQKLEPQELGRQLVIREIPNKSDWIAGLWDEVRLGKGFGPYTSDELRTALREYARLMQPRKDT